MRHGVQIGPWVILILLLLLLQPTSTTLYPFNVAADDVSWRGETVGSDSIISADVPLHLLTYGVVKPQTAGRLQWEIPDSSMTRHTRCHTAWYVVLHFNLFILLCPRPRGIKWWCCLTSVWCLSRTSARWAACAAGRLDGAYWLIGPGSAGLAQVCRWALPLQASVGAYCGSRPPTAYFIMTSYM